MSEVQSVCLSVDMIYREIGTKVSFLKKKKKKPLIILNLFKVNIKENEKMSNCYIFKKKKNKKKQEKHRKKKHRKKNTEKKRKEKEKA